MQKGIWRRGTDEERMPGTELRTNTFGILFCGLILFEGEGGIIGTARNFLYTCIFCQWLCVSLRHGIKTSVTEHSCKSISDILRFPKGFLPPRDFLSPALQTLQVLSVCPSLASISAWWGCVVASAIPFLLEQAQAVKANTPRFGGVHDNGVLVSLILSSWGREVHRSMTGVTTCLELMNNQIAMLKSWWAAKSQNS